MDETTAARARERFGVVMSEDLGGHPGRVARRTGLMPLRPGAWLAQTQPDDVPTALAAVRATASERAWTVMGAAALWLHGAGPCPEELEIGVALGHRLAVRPPARTRRVAAAVLENARWRQGVRVVSLEVAVLQCSTSRGLDEVVGLVEELVRGRRTTLARLRARCRRGLAGSARLRAACDVLAGGSMEKDVRVLRRALEAQGVTGLESEVRFTSDAGASAYADLLHRPTMTVFEVDGRVEHSRRTQFRADRRRDRWMRRQHSVTTLRVDVLEIRDSLDALVVELLWFVTA